MFFPLVVLRKIEKTFSSYLEAPEQLIKLVLATWDIRSENSPFAPARFSFSFTSLW